MSTSPAADHPPIYGQLVRELGDALADTRKAAEETHARAREALDFRGIRASTGANADRFSAFAPRAARTAAGRPPTGPSAEGAVTSDPPPGARTHVLPLGRRSAE